jgi:hypothetical protein
MQIFRFIFRFEYSFAFVWLKVGRLCAAGLGVGKKTESRKVKMLLFLHKKTLANYFDKGFM